MHYGLMLEARGDADTAEKFFLQMQTIYHKEVV
jgi:hypothetical protein